MLEPHPYAIIEGCGCGYCKEQRTLKTTLKEQVVSILTGCVIKSATPFTLKSGKISNTYIDCRMATLDPGKIYKITNLLGEWLKNDSIGLDKLAIGGPEIGACPIVSSIGIWLVEHALPIKCNLFYVRKTPKDHGTGQFIVGPQVESGTRAILVEDVVTSGGSLIAAIQHARAYGMIVDTAYCLVDREDGGREALEAIGVKLYSITTLNEIFISEQNSDSI